MIPTRVPDGTTVPGCKGTAPTRTSGAFPGLDSAAATLWLASVPLLHGVFSAMDGRLAARSAPRAAAIFSPITLGTATPGAVGVEVGAVDVVVGAAVVVVRMWRTAFFRPAVGELPQDVRRQAMTSTVAASALTRPREGMVPSWCLSCCDAAPGAPARQMAPTRPVERYFRMLTARATTRMATTNEMASSAIIMSFIHGFTADTSVGLKAVAVANAKWK